MTPALRWAAMRAVLMFVLTVRDKVTRQCFQTTTFKEKGEPKRIRTEVPLLTNLTPYRWATPAYNVDIACSEDSSSSLGRRTTKRADTIHAVQLHCQDPHTKRFKRTLIYFDPDTLYGNFGEIPFVKPQNDT